MGKAHCFILMTGPDFPNKTEGNFTTDFDFWFQWIAMIMHDLGPDVGFILFEAPDAAQGASRLHATLSALAGEGYTGTVGVVGHSNGAAALIQYMGEAQAGQFTGDAVINKFVALDAPINLGSPAIFDVETIWAHPWEQWIGGANGYMQANGTQGAYAWEPEDPLSGGIPGFNVPQSSMLPAHTGWFGLVGPIDSHYALAIDPQESLVQMVE